MDGVDINDPYVQHIRGQRENLEPSFVNFLKANFQDSSVTALDIGANIGVTSLLMGRILEESKIYAFEPGSKVYQLLRSNIVNNGLSNRVFPVHAAISDCDGSACFEENSAYGHISQSGISVKMISVQSYAKENGLENIDFIKIDVEGFEPEVFKGISGLDKQPIVYFELNTWTLLAYGRHNPLEFLESLLADWDLYEVISANELLPIRDSNDVLRAVHSTMVLRGCVSDCIAAPKGTEISLKM